MYKCLGKRRHRGKGFDDFPGELWAHQGLVQPSLQMRVSYDEKSVSLAPGMRQIISLHEVIELVLKFPPVILHSSDATVAIRNSTTKPLESPPPWAPDGKPLIRQLGTQQVVSKQPNPLQ